MLERPNRAVYLGSGRQAEEGRNCGCDPEAVFTVNLVEFPNSSSGESDLNQRTSATTSVEPASVGMTPPTTGVDETGDRDEYDSLGTVNAHKCDVCSATFESKSGLGQHVRHCHPNLANKLRLQAAKKDIERKRAARKGEQAKQCLPSAYMLHVSFTLGLLTNKVEDFKGSSCYGPLYFGSMSFLNPANL